MNKGLVIGIVVFMLLGVGGYFAFQGSSDSDSNTQIASTGEDANSIAKNSSGEKISGTFMDLLKLGKNYTCTIDSKDEAGNATSGTVYVASKGDKLNGDFVMTQVDGTRMEAKVIRDGKFNYTWGSFAEEGYKTPITDADDSIFGGSSDNKSNSTGLSDDENVDFDCKRWSVDNSKFVPPSNIKFIDLSEQMQQIDNAEELLGDIDCSVCDNAPVGAAREQCRAAIGCSQ